MTRVSLSILLSESHPARSVSYSYQIPSTASTRGLTLAAGKSIIIEQCEPSFDKIPRTSSHPSNLMTLPCNSHSCRVVNECALYKNEGAVKAPAAAEMSRE